MTMFEMILHAVLSIIVLFILFDNYKLRGAAKCRDQELESTKEKLDLERQYADSYSSLYRQKCNHKQKIDERLHQARHKIKGLKRLCDELRANIVFADEKTAEAYKQVGYMTLRACPTDCKWSAHKSAGIFPCPSCRIVRSNYVPTKGR